MVPEAGLAPLNLVFHYRWCKKSDTRSRSLETCSELQCLPEHRVCRDRPHTSVASFSQIRLNVRRLRNDGVAQEYKGELRENLAVLNDSDDPGNLWTDFKTKVLNVSDGYLRDTPGTSKSFLTKENLNIIVENRRARLKGKTRQYREPNREAVRAVRIDKMRKSVESARQCRAACGQPALVLPTEESGRCVSPIPRPAVLQ